MRVVDALLPGACRIEQLFDGTRLSPLRCWNFVLAPTLRSQVRRLRVHACDEFVFAKVHLLAQAFFPQAHIGCISGAHRVHIGFACHERGLCLCCRSVICRRCGRFSEQEAMQARRVEPAWALIKRHESLMGRVARPRLLRRMGGHLGAYGVELDVAAQLSSTHVIHKDRFAPITSGCDVLNGSREFDSEGSSHGPCPSIRQAKIRI
jgi:hypothetical protein